jgi:hypothetical protein
MMAAAALGSAVWLAPLWIHPLRHSLRPAEHATRASFRVFPPELTMLNDLATSTEPWRKKVPYGDTEGDPHKHWPADPKAYWLYFLDDGTAGKEVRGALEGFSLRGGRSTEIVLRALEPVRRIHVHARADSAEDGIDVSVCGAHQVLDVGKGDEREVVFEPGAGFPYFDSFLTVLRLRTSHPDASMGSPGLPDTFAWITLETDRRPRP